MSTALDLPRARAFLTAAGALRASNGEARRKRLERFFGDAGLLLRAPAALRPRRRTPAVADARRLLEQVAGPLHVARTSGEFIDVWAVAGLKRKEVRNAAVLAWLLDPRGSHGQGAACLNALMDIVASQAPAWRLSPHQLRGARVQTEQRPLGSERDRVDIAIQGSDFLLFIEVKIDAAEGERQLSRYLEAAAAKAAALAVGQASALRTLVVYLSPRPPAEDVSGVVQIRWEEVSDAILTVAARAQGYAHLVIRSFGNHIRAFS